MRTGRALTVSGGASQKNFFGGKKLKNKKIGEPPLPKNVETTGDHPPPEKLETPLPKKFEPPRKIGDPPSVNTRLWKYYLGPTSLRPVINFSVTEC